MRDKQPIVAVPLTPIDIALILLGVVAVVLAFVAPAWNWSALPREIPTHFTFSGEPDAWGNRGMLWMLPAITAVSFASLAFLARFPHIFNYLWKITEENAPRQYALARRLLFAMAAEVAWLFLYITWRMIRTAFGEVHGLGWAFLTIVLVVMAGTITVYLVNAARAR